jgi:sugar transferase (PEP-CTERM/EpsH1 system associated)
MKILMISPYLPWPLYGGASVRIFNIIKELSQRGHRIVLVAGKKKDSDLSNNILYQLCEKVYLYELPSMGRLHSIIHSLFSRQPYPTFQFQNKHLSEIVYDLLKNERFDLLWINFLFMADVLSKITVRNTSIILDQFEADELIWERYIQKGNFIQKIFSYSNLKKIQALQRKVFKYINTLLCVSEIEAEFMKSRVPQETEVWVAPNGADIDFFQPKVIHNKSEPIILITGGMCVKRNIEAAIWFAKKIFPKIKKVVSEAQFWIVGSYPDKKVLALKIIPGVVVTGTVREIRTYYQKAKVYVAPFRFGEGTRLKVLEAMAMGIPIVSTEMGCQGIEVIDGEHLLMAKTEDEFAEKVIELLSSSQKGQALAKASRKLIEQKYNWKVIVDTLELKLKKFIKK